jgi:RNA polymerase-interacting CarD/CdnL/TRCF family regulator
MADLHLNLSLLLINFNQEKMKLAIPVELPEKVGSYTIKLRLRGKNKFFGQTVLILAEVHKKSSTSCTKYKERFEKIYSTTFA